MCAIQSQDMVLVASSSLAGLFVLNTSMCTMHADSYLPVTVLQLLPGVASNTCTVDSVLLLLRLLLCCRNWLPLWLPVQVTLPPCCLLLACPTAALLTSQGQPFKQDTALQAGTA